MVAPPFRFPEGAEAPQLAVQSKAAWERPVLNLQTENFDFLDRASRLSMHSQVLRQQCLPDLSTGLMSTPQATFIHLTLHIVTRTMPHTAIPLVQPTSTLRHSSYPIKRLLADHYTHSRLRYRTLQQYLLEECHREFHANHSSTLWIAGAVDRTLPSTSNS